MEIGVKSEREKNDRKEKKGRKENREENRGFLVLDFIDRHSSLET